MREFFRGWRRKVGLATLAIAILLYLTSQGLFISCRPVVVQEATTADEIRHRCFGMDPIYEWDVRSIAVAEGTFSKNTWLNVSLYLVQAGIVDEENTFTVGRSPNRFAEELWINMKIKLALGDSKLPTGRITQVGSIGHTRGSGSYVEVIHDIRIVEKRILPGRLWSGSEYIVYVEGDRKFEVSRNSSIKEFAAANDGNFLVVVVKLN